MYGTYSISDLAGEPKIILRKDCLWGNILHLDNLLIRTSLLKCVHIMMLCRDVFSKERPSPHNNSSTGVDDLCLLDVVES